MKRGILIYVSTIVLPACVLLGFGIQTFLTQRRVVETLTAEKLATKLEASMHKAAEAAFVDGYGAYSVF